MEFDACLIHELIDTLAINEGVSNSHLLQLELSVPKVCHYDKLIDEQESVDLLIDRHCFSTFLSGT